MKKLLLLSIAFIGLSVCWYSPVNAQGVGINPSGAAPNSSAGFDVDFTNKGMLIPRMTTSQRDAISNPVISLLIFNADCKQYQFWNGVQWVDMMNNLAGSPPIAPTAATSTPSQTQIVWNWNTVSGATGYQWNTVNTYPGVGVNTVASTTYTQTGLTCNTAYNLYVWTYNSCGNSTATTLTQTTSACCISGNISTIAGIGTAGFSGDGAAATAAQLHYPRGVALDGSGNVYIGDVTNAPIKVMPK